MWNLKVIDVDKPLYLAIADAMERDIREGVLPAGERMPTHRELAKLVGVTVTTATRAYREAERRGLITAIVGNGTFVTSDRGFNPSLAQAELAAGRSIEMGLVFPTYAVEANLRQVLDRVMRKTDLQALMRYIPPEGLPKHRQTGVDWVGRFGVRAGADDIVITAGAQHAVTCLFMSAFEPGDRIACDCLVYPGVKSLARRCGIRLEGVPMDGGGLLPDALDALCRRHRIKGVYTVGSLQNPTNTILSSRRKRDIAEVIEKRDLILIEDDLYGFLLDRPGPALSSLVPENGVYIAGLSKAFYAGLRVGFSVVPRALRTAFTQAVVDTMWMASPLCVEGACESIAGGTADAIIAAQKKELDVRAATAAKALRDYKYSHAEHSMFLWLHLPDQWPSDIFEAAARDGGVNVVSADKFIVGSMPRPNCVRLSLSAPNTDKELKKGLDILLHLLNSKRGGGARIL